MKLKIIEKIFHKRELASLKAECDLLAMAYKDLLNWGEYTYLKLPELRMIRDAMENPLFKETVYEFKSHWGYRKCYEELLSRIKIVIKRREVL